VEGGILPAVSRAVFSLPQSTGNAVASSGFSSPRNALSSTAGVVVAVNETLAQPLTPTQQISSSATQSGLPFDEEAKLVYGVVLSLRNMIKKLTGRYDLQPSAYPDFTL
jgi:hypothetical protein